MQFRVRKTPTCSITSCARLRSALQREHQEGTAVLQIRVCYETSNTLWLWLIQKVLQIVPYSTNKTWWWLSHTEKHTSQLSWPKGRNDIDMRACVCLCLYAHGFIGGFFSTCLFIHLPLCLCMSISLCPLCICAEFGQHLQSVFCLFSSPLAWNVFLFLCQLCEATLSQILWNQLNVRQGLMQIKFMALCIAHIILQSL